MNEVAAVYECQHNAVGWTAASPLLNITRVANAWEDAVFHAKTVRETMATASAVGPSTYKAIVDGVKRETLARLTGESDGVRIPLGAPAL